MDSYLIPYKNYLKTLRLSLHAGDMTLHIENSEDSTQKLLELIEEFSKAVGYKINMQNLVAFLH